MIGHLTESLFSPGLDRDIDQVGGLPRRFQLALQEGILLFQLIPIDPQDASDLVGRDQRPLPPMIDIGQGHRNLKRNLCRATFLGPLLPKRRRKYVILPSNTLAGVLQSMKKSVP